MAHPQQQNFCLYVKQKFPLYFIGKKILDCGSLDINGNNRYLFYSCNYLGIDVGPGKNVDIISTIHEFDYPDNSFEVIISTECFEHDKYYEKSLLNISRLLKSNGLFLFTCATTGRGEHGTLRTGGLDSPLTVKIPGWEDYYKNLDETDIRKAIDIDKTFKLYEFKTNQDPYDLYFYGIKK